MAIGHSIPPRQVASVRASRPRELQDGLNHYLYHPLAWRLALLLARTPITPNMVSIVGGLFVVAAAFTYAQPGWPIPALVGLLLHMTWHIVDGADGDLARLTGRSSPTGELVDGICDYASHVVLYVVLAWMLQSLIDPLLAWPMTAVSGASHIIQSNHFEVQRRQYQWWVYGVAWLRNGGGATRPNNRTLAALRAAYLTLAGTLAPQALRIDAAVERASADAASLDAIRATIRRHATSLLPRFQLLGANYRTVALGLAMLVGSPLYYFLYETVLLNLLLVRSIWASEKAAARIADEIDQLGTAKV